MPYTNADAANTLMPHTHTHNVTHFTSMIFPLLILIQLIYVSSMTDPVPRIFLVDFGSWLPPVFY
jgi:uncharacterized protein YqhQ